MFYTYVLQSMKMGTTYVGITSDLRRRLSEHYQGLNLSTKHALPWRVIYYEACLNKTDASRREGYFKKTQGKRLLQRRLKEFLYEQKKI